MSGSLVLVAYSKEQLNTLPSEFDWLDREDLNEEFENKAHLRNHLIVTLNRHFDDLELQSRGYRKLLRKGQ
jgi:hypothetical protein